MRANPVLDALRQRISSLEETQRRFARTIPVADEIDRWLPQGGLSANCIHEIKGTSLAAAIAFSAVLSSRLAGEDGPIVYLTPDRSLHPLGLLPFGIKMDQLLHVSAKRRQDREWAVMEALRCPQVRSVIALIDGLDLAESRRLQLAAETSGVTGFFLGTAASAPIASPITRWKIASCAGKARQRFDEPSWRLDLLYCRGGRPGSWVLEWREQTLQTVPARPMKPVRQVVREAMAG